MEASCKYQSYQDLERINELLRTEINGHLQLERQLIEAKIAADERTAACNSLLSDMGHEIRTPMNSIIGMTSILLLDETLTDEQKEFIETIKVSSDALMELINDILDYSRLESKRLNLDPHPFELKSFVKETIDSIATDASGERPAISYRFRGAVPKRIVQDSTRLRQILSGILVNAVNLIDPGEIKLYISSRRVDGGAEIHFELNVPNSDANLNPDAIDELLQPFGGNDSAEPGEYSGSGLRLANGKRLAQLMDGDIWIEFRESNSPTINVTIKAGLAS